MEWLNLHTSILDSVEVIGADPVERSTWLMLQRWCIGQENGGRIRNCREWKDRKWQQLVRVTKREIGSGCSLWHWDGDDLKVWGYPSEKEDEVRSKRDVARSNGKKGGRPPKIKENETDVETQQKPTLVSGEKPSPKAEREGEGKGKVPPYPPGGEMGGGRRPRGPDLDDDPLVPPITLEQALSCAAMSGMSPEEAAYWWRKRNATGWTKGSPGGGAPRRILSPQDDMATSVRWVREEMGQTKQQRPNGRSARAC